MQFLRTFEGTDVQMESAELNGGMVYRSACTVSHVRIFNDDSRFRCTRWKDDEAKQECLEAHCFFC